MFCTYSLRFTTKSENFSLKCLISIISKTVDFTKYFEDKMHSAFLMLNKVISLFFLHDKTAEISIKKQKQILGNMLSRSTLIDC